jgi:hypothetical protein
LLNAIRTRDFFTFTQRYNGQGNEAVYMERIQANLAAYERLRAQPHELAAMPASLQPEPAQALPGSLDLEPAALWRDHIQQGLSGNQALFDQILQSVKASYQTTTRLFWGLFGMGVEAFLAALGLALATGNLGLVLSFAALSAVALLACALNRPLRSQEEHLYYLMSLGVAYNSYWAKLAHLDGSLLADPAQAQQAVDSVTNDTMARLQTLATSQAERN